MCSKRMIHYRECDHTWGGEILRCAAALARPQQALCIPPSGHIRDLPQELDAQDRNQPGKCPACLGTTPPSSVGSQEL